MPPTELKIKDAQAYILANGVKADTDAMGDVLTETPAHIRKIVIEPAISTVNVAVTQDAKDNHVADFIVNLKEPASCKDAPRPGPRSDSSRPRSWTAPTIPTRIPRRRERLPRPRKSSSSDGFIQQEKKAAPVHHKPSPAHHAE